MKRTLLETILLFSVFYLPGYLQQSGGMEARVFLSPLFHFHYLIRAIPQLLLMIYLLSLSRGGDIRKKYGLTVPRKGDIGSALLTFLGVLAVAMAAGAVSSVFDASAPFSDSGTSTTAALYGGGIELSLSSPFTYILLFLTCAVIGYHEELFFRAYLLSEFIPQGQNDWILRGGHKSATVLAGSLLFAAGHLYQGGAGFIGTFTIGLFLSFRFLRRRSLHEVAIAHTFYNFTAILVLLLIKDFGLPR